MKINEFYDERTSTLTYVVFDPDTKDAVVVDPVMDYDPVGSKVFFDSVERVAEFIEEQGLRLRVILETHAHADHLSGSQVLKARYPDAKLAIGAKITTVQKVFKKVFDLPADFPTDGRQFDLLLEDGDVFEAGSLRFEAMHTPGHTPACATWKIEDAIFTGDLLFMPDQGTGRCDFPAGSAADLYRSVKERVYTLPDATRVFVGHDYQPGGREVRWETTVSESKRSNVQLAADTPYDAFVTAREARDKSLAAPSLLYQSVQVNVDAGHLPTAVDNGRRYLKIPVNVFRPKAEGPLGTIVV